MTDTTGNIVPVRPLEEDSALAWLRSQPGGSTTLPAAALARRWGWNERRTRRRLSAWQKSGLVRRRGRAVMAVGGDVRPPEVTLLDVRNQDQVVDIAAKRNPAIRSLAAAAGKVVDPPGWERSHASADSSSSGRTGTILPGTSVITGRLLGSVTTIPRRYQTLGRPLPSGGAPRLAHVAPAPPVHKLVNETSVPPSHAEVRRLMDRVEIS